MEGRLEDASIAFRMPLICSGLPCWFPSSPFPRKLTLTKCHACLLFPLLPSPLQASLILSPLFFLLALTPISFPLSSLDLKGE